MATQIFLTYAALIAFLVVAAGIDLRHRKIPNWLTVALIIGGIGQTFMPRSLISPSQSLAGFAIGFALPLILFCIGALGGGDVKLLSGIGAWLGPVAVFAVFIAAMLIALVLVLAQSIWQRKLIELLKNSFLLIVMLLNFRRLGETHVTSTARTCRCVGKPLPYAVPILLATIALLTRWP